MRRFPRMGAAPRLALLLILLAALFAPTLGSGSDSVHGILACPQTAEACGEMFNNCSMRGECVRQGVTALKSCYFCACDSTGQASWSGDSCQYQDISADFHVLFWVSVVLALAVVQVIGMMLRATADDDKDRESLTNTGAGHAKVD